jgi:hypothetical protein
VLAIAPNKARRNGIGNACFAEATGCQQSLAWNFVTRYTESGKVEKHYWVEFKISTCAQEK